MFSLIHSNTAEGFHKLQSHSNILGVILLFIVFIQNIQITQV